MSKITLRRMNFTVAVFLFGIVTVLLVGCHRSPVPFPYDRTSPVVYDNDSVVDVYTDEYLLALASLGEIQLKGMMTSSSIAPDNPAVKPEDYESEVSNRDKVTAAARASGFRNVPVPVRGPMGMLRKPPSGKIGDTQPIGSAGTRLIVEEARKCTPEKPLVVIVGGPLTAEADAYLTDPSIADKMIVGWLALRNRDMGQYNGVADPWAAYITLQKLRLVQFGQVQTPRVLKSDLLKLPASPLQKFMYEAYLPSTPPGPGDYDGDAPPAIALMRPDYAKKINAAEFGGFFNFEGHQLPVFKRDFLVLASRAFHRALRIPERGRAVVVVNADGSIATEEWWRAIRAALGVHDP